VLAALKAERAKIKPNSQVSRRRPVGKIGIGRWKRPDPSSWKGADKASKIRRKAEYLQLASAAGSASVMESQSSNQSIDSGLHFQQAIRRWGKSLAIRLPADCLREAGLREGNQITIVVGGDGRLSLQPLQQLDRSALAADLRQMQTAMPLTPSVIDE
jgi:antitoxin MazE